MPAFTSAVSNSHSGGVRRVARAGKGPTPYCELHICWWQCRRGRNYRWHTRGRRQSSWRHSSRWEHDRR